MSKYYEDTLYLNKVQKNFFKDENERNLWVRLNAEHIQYANKILNHIDKSLGEIGVPYSYMQISSNQLVYDEYMRDAPRFSFEELVLPHPELFRLSQKRNQEAIKKIFGDVEGIVKLGEIEDEDL